jgi:hypothetical protein
MAAFIKDYLKALIGLAVAGAATVIVVTTVIALFKLNLVALLTG